MSNPLKRLFGKGEREQDRASREEPAVRLDSDADANAQQVLGALSAPAPSVTMRTDAARVSTESDVLVRAGAGIVFETTDDHLQTADGFNALDAPLNLFVSDRGIGDARAAAEYLAAAGRLDSETYRYVLDLVKKERARLHAALETQYTVRQQQIALADGRAQAVRLEELPRRAEEIERRLAEIERSGAKGMGEQGKASHAGHGRIAGFTPARRTSTRPVAWPQANHDDDAPEVAAAVAGA